MDAVACSCSHYPRRVPCCARVSCRWDSLIIVGPKSLPWLTLARIVFIPLFLLSLHPKVRCVAVRLVLLLPLPSPPPALTLCSATCAQVFVSDVWMYIFMIGMGLTNGCASPRSVV